MKRFSILLAGLALSFALARVSSAQHIYVDYLITGGNGAPSSSFGAAYGVPGAWNNLDFLESNAAVFDTDGNLTGVTISNLAGGQFANEPSTSGDVEKLLDDGIDSSIGFSITISGLAAGTYDVYSYAWHPATAGDQLATQITVNGLDPQIVQRTGAFSGFALGETHALHSVTISSGQDIVIAAADGGGPIPGSVLNGFQIVPEPSTFVLCGFGVLALLKFRRVRPGGIRPRR